ncbi:MAG: hypothetical protein KDK97_19450 [Verrucomicrobiales bacterium]|nr:hypothetical protein [Verrucomicrobiales bacterium]
MKLQARNFELFSLNPVLADELRPLFTNCEGMPFPYTIGKRNNNQITSGFDEAIQAQFGQSGTEFAPFKWLEGKGYTCDFAFRFRDSVWVAEAEKSNSDKILYDFLKFHFYLAAGADAVLLLLPKNWSHRSGEVDMFAMGKERLEHCQESGFGSPQFFERTLIVGYEQATADGRTLTSAERRELIGSHHAALAHQSNGGATTV